MIAFAEHLKSLPNSGTITKVSGVIATSPLFELVHPPPLVIRTVVGWLVKLFPNVTMPAVVPEEVSGRTRAERFLLMQFELIEVL